VVGGHSQATQVLDPILAPTPEGIKLADILLSLGTEIDAGILGKPILGAFTRYVLGDEIAGGRRIPREPVWDTLLRTLWPPFVLAREGLSLFSGADNVYWMFDEFLRKVALLFLSEGTVEAGGNRHPRRRDRHSHRRRP
jgi:endo-cleaving rubber dioxygenase